MNLTFTRAMVNAAIEGKLDDVPAKPHPIFGVSVPESCPGVPPEILDARTQWSDPTAYDKAAHNLESLFRANFEKFGAPAEELLETTPAR